MTGISGITSGSWERWTGGNESQPDGSFASDREPAEKSFAECLTGRERDILRRMVQGCSNSEIADQLCMARSTVKWYVNQIYAKLKVHSRDEAIDRASELVPCRTPVRDLPAHLTGRLQPTSLPQTPVNPYKGPRPFQIGDAPYFFGRELFTKQLIQHLASPNNDGHLLAVVGAKGSGKSSVIKAGLLPSLHRSALPSSGKLLITEMVPGTHPYEELEAAVLRVSSGALPGLLNQMTEDQRGLVRGIKRVLPVDPEVELVLVIDQLEELFELTDDTAIRTSFIESLLAAETDPCSRVRIVLTFCSESSEYLLLYPHLAELIRRNTMMMTPLSTSELEYAICGPAERVGLIFEAGLVTAISNDMIRLDASLSDLQRILYQLYERREGRRLMYNVYLDIIGL